MMPSLLCLGEHPTFFIFDFSTAPALLWYSYIPAIVIALSLGVFILRKDQYSARSLALFAVVTSFALWTLNIFVQWTASYVDAQVFSWQLTGLFELPIFLCAIYFTYAFLDKNQVSLKLKVALSLAMLPVLVLLPTRFNVAYFDISACEAGLSYLWVYIYLAEIASILWVFILGFRRYVVALRSHVDNQIAHITFGVLAFLVFFAGSNIVGQLTGFYEINLLGPIGTVIFISLLTYIMVRYKAFNVKLLATDALILALCLLIGSQLFFVTVPINYLIIGITLALAMLFGLILSRSVRREVAQREGLQILSDQLSQANTKLTEVSHFKTQLLSIASHQIKAPLAALKGYLELIFEKAYGEIPETLVKPLTSMRTSADGLVELITSLLDLRKIDEGKMDYQFTRNDLTEIVKGVVGELQLLATGKQLALTASGLDASVWVQADVPKLKQVIVNLVDNAIKYTPSGSVSVTLASANRHAIVEVADTGLGMSPALLPRLFDEFTRDQRVQRTIRGTGLGLYIAKRIIEAHGGTVVAHSDGEGMGSRFTVTLPLDLSN